MLLQSLRLAWPIFSQGWPLFYFCHLWATQLLIHMQMKLTPALVCIRAPRCLSAHNTALRTARPTLFGVVAQLGWGGREKSHIPGRDTQGGGAYKITRYTCASLGNLCSCLVTGSAADAACCFAPPLSAVRAADRRRRRQRKEGRERERASCRGRSPEWLRGGSLVTGNAKACDETCALSGVCCRRFTRASQVSPQQKGASDTSSYPTRARCTTWTAQVITRLASALSFFLSLSLHSKLLSLNPLPLPCCLPLLHTFTPLLSLAHILCAQLASVRKVNWKLQRGRIRRFFLNSGICSCYDLLPQAVSKDSFYSKSYLYIFWNDLLCIHSAMPCSWASDSVHFLGKSPSHERNGKGMSKGFLFDKGSSIFDTSIELKSTGLTPAWVKSIQCIDSRWVTQCLLCVFHCGGHWSAHKMITGHCSGCNIVFCYLQGKAREGGGVVLKTCKCVKNTQCFTSVHQMCI